MNKDYKALGLAREDLVRMYRTMTLIREFEENAVAYFKQGIVIGNMHMYVGEEATATGICYALTKEDYVASTHRCDGHLIAKGADTKAMMAELMGRENGICGGRAGKMHQSSPDVGFMAANGIVGASISQATGHALYCQMYAPGRVAVAFFGDGGGNQGAFLECINMASVWKLPAVYVCENNHYAISTSVESSTALGHFWQRAEGLGIPGVLVNGNDGESSCENTDISGSLTYADLVNLWNSFGQYKMTTILVNPSMLPTLLNMAEFRDAAAGLNFHATGKLITPFGAQILRSNFLPDDMIIAFDKNAALETVQSGDVTVDSDKLIDRQLERVAITSTCGFNRITADAVRTLTLGS